jgi:cytochrome c peroxidase
VAVPETGDRRADECFDSAPESRLVGRPFPPLVPIVFVGLSTLAGLLAAEAVASPPRGETALPRDRFEWRLPPGFPTPLVPAGESMTSAKVELGRHLFYDTRLSGNGTQACGTCHRQELAFTDGRPRAVGSLGDVHRRSSMSLANVAYNVALTWADPGLRGLETQALVPMFGEHPVEMGLAGKEGELLARLEADGRYVDLFHAAFPDEARPIRIENVTRALAAFERTLISGDSPYDRLVYRGQSDALSEAAWRGMRLFFSDRLACSKCHAGFTFSGPVTFEGSGDGTEPVFHDTGLYNIDGRGGYPAEDTGLLAVTHRRRDMGRFRAPTLRNIALTAPYMHDGSLATLEAVIDHYAAGGRAGGSSRYKSALLRGFTITPEERRDLIEFLRSLTDESFVADPRFADPSRAPGPP